PLEMLDPRTARPYEPKAQDAPDLPDWEPVAPGRRIRAPRPGHRSPVLARDARTERKYDSDRLPWHGEWQRLDPTPSILPFLVASERRRRYPQANCRCVQYAGQWSGTTATCQRPPSRAVHLRP